MIFEDCNASHTPYRPLGTAACIVMGLTGWDGLDPFLALLLWKVLPGIIVQQSYDCSEWFVLL